MLWVFIKFHYIEKKGHISTADISNTLQLPLKQSVWIESATVKRKNMSFGF